MMYEQGEIKISLVYLNIIWSIALKPIAIKIVTIDTAAGTTFVPHAATTPLFLFSLSSHPRGKV